jgi:hypothetical protein
MNLPLQPDESKSARGTGLKHYHTLDNHTKICHTSEALEDRTTFQLSDTEKSGWFHGNKKFKVGDTEELELFGGKHTFELRDFAELRFFCHKRLELISKEVLDKITSCWFQQFVLRMTEEDVQPLEHTSFSEQEKCG